MKKQKQNKQKHLFRPVRVIAAHLRVLGKLFHDVRQTKMIYYYYIILHSEEVLACRHEVNIPLKVVAITLPTAKVSVIVIQDEEEDGGCLAHLPSNLNANSATHRENCTTGV